MTLPVPLLVSDDPCCVPSDSNKVAGLALDALISSPIPQAWLAVVISAYDQACGGHKRLVMRFCAAQKMRLLPKGSLGLLSRLAAGSRQVERQKPEGSVSC